MGFYEKIILKDVPSFQELTAEQKKQDLTLHKHQYIAVWITCLFVGSIIPYLVGLVICVVNCVFYYLVGGVPSNILFYTTMPIAIVIFCIYIIIIYRYERKKEKPEEVGEFLIEKFQNLWLLNWQVISFRDWNNIKKRYKKLYEKARSENCNHKCYDTTYAIANVLHNPEIKILWICVSAEGEKWGHAVLAKNGKIYDSNLRRTFNRKEYTDAFEVEIFKEYSLEEYLDKENLPESCFLYLDWEEFGKWCVEHNAVRND